MKPALGVLISAMALTSLLGSTAAMAATGSISGKINGHGCAHHGQTCPVDRLDPHLALEPDFVVQQANGEYYFMSNLPRTTKVRYALMDVTVSGDIDDRHRNIVVDEFVVNGKTVWSRKQQQEERERLYSEGAYAF